MNTFSLETTSGTLDSERVSSQSYKMLTGASSQMHSQIEGVCGKTEHKMLSRFCPGLAAIRSMRSFDQGRMQRTKSLAASASGRYFSLCPRL